MNRRRRTAFHADSDDEYLAKVKTADVIESFSKATMDEITAYSPPDKLQDLISRRSAPNYSERNPCLNSITAVSRSDTFNFIVNTDYLQSDSSPDQDRSPRKSSDSDPSKKDGETNRKDSTLVTSVKTMIIGSNRLYKHAFIDYLFGKSPDNGELKTPLDLRVESNLKVFDTVKHHFWMQSCREGDISDRLKPIYMIYYKTVSSIVFMYSVEDRSSFLLVNQAIKSLAADFVPNKFNGILIGLKTSKSEFAGNQEKPREVSQEDGEHLKQEAGLKEFLEVDLADGSQRDSILNLLEDLKKQKC